MQPLFAIMTVAVPAAAVAPRGAPMPATARLAQDRALSCAIAVRIPTNPQMVPPALFAHFATGAVQRLSGQARR